MSIPKLADLPDDHPIYIVGHGEFTAGQLRDGRRDSKPSRWEEDLRILEAIATRNIKGPCRKNGATHADVKA